MRKSLLAVLVGAFTLSTASANFYVQGDLGLSKIKFTSYSGMTKTKIIPSLAVGYKFADWRLAIDYSHYGRFSDKVGNESLSSKIYSLGFSALYDFNVNYDVKPYVGVRIASNSFDINNSSPGFLNDRKETKLGYGAIVGGSYNFSPNWDLNAGLEYNRLGSFADTKINQYGAKVGVRYEF
ncbi:opacity protein-like surface antigen [Bisgaardia hudsonensis]|uniref:Opacity protein-like surface antigen n=1 Tax=Bisgaardia hudsonensis TaxID=109472 RepID=A0A4R2N2P4_9PAST|nr:opacity family porin [Bisgaardia hudsonensis]QLB12556.1 acetylglucosamine transferase [Bisgaardia hudsonensis]TCP14097.1 opacity protein-like surface antigen [Bisgaardia hudsonensis]